MNYTAYYALRSEVFVVEQNCVYQDIDGKDKNALHITGYLERRKLLRMQEFSTKALFTPEYCSIGRIATSFSERGKKHWSPIGRVFNKTNATKVLTVGLLKFLPRHI